MDSVQIDKELKAFFNENKDIEKADHFKFFDRATGLQQGSAESTWLAGLKALADSKQPKFAKAADILQKKYNKSKREGWIKSYWKKRKAEQELVDEADDAANETAKCVVRSSRLKACRAFNIVDERTIGKAPIRGLKGHTIGDDLVDGFVDDSVDDVLDDFVQENAIENEDLEVLPAQLQRSHSLHPESEASCSSQVLKPPFLSFSNTCIPGPFTLLPSSHPQEEVAENSAAEFSSADVEKGISDPDVADVEIVWSRAKFTPFYDLVTYVFQKTKKKPAVLPSTIPNDHSEIHRELYSVILNELKKPGPVESNKDVLVMLSGIVNTIAPSGRSLTLSKTIMASSILAPVDPQSDTHVAVTAVQEKLLDALYPALKKDPYADPQFVQLQKAIWKELCHAVDLKQTELGLATYITLQIMDRIVAWIEQGSFQPPTSEHMFVSAWAWIFNTLFTGTRLRVVPGELISRASADARRIVETEFGPTTSTVSGRKVDMSLRIQVDNQWKSEIAVFEFKSVNATQRICDIQQKKSIRLNAAILMDLESRGLDLTHHYPIVAEGKGLGLDFYALRRYGDVLGVGRSTRKGIMLPSDVAELKTFLQSNSLLTLFAFR
ncbi:hypothetical protein BGX20_003162, partial [Mortierella sp. AD010]